MSQFTDFQMVWKLSRLFIKIHDGLNNFQRDWKLSRCFGKISKTKIYALFDAIDETIYALRLERFCALQSATSKVLNSFVSDVHCIKVLLVIEYRTVEHFQLTV